MKTFRIRAAETVTKLIEWEVEAASEEAAREKFHEGERRFVRDVSNLDCEVGDIQTVVESGGPPDSTTVSIDDTVADYCREEGTDLEEARALVGWLEDLDAVPARYGEVDYSDESSVSGTELSWKMPLAAAFWLRLNRRWFDIESSDPGGRLAEILRRVSGEDVDPDDFTNAERDGYAAQISAMYAAFAADPTNKEEAAKPPPPVGGE